MNNTDLAIIALLCGVCFTPSKTFSGVPKSRAFIERRRESVAVEIDRRQQPVVFDVDKLFGSTGVNLESW